MISQAILPCEARACSRCSTWAPCGDHCCVLYQCLLFLIACFAICAHVLCLWSVCDRVSMCFSSAVCLILTISIPISAVLSGVWSWVGCRGRRWEPVKTRGIEEIQRREGAIELCQAAIIPRTLRIGSCMPKAARNKKWGWITQFTPSQPLGLRRWSPTNPPTIESKRDCMVRSN